MQVKRQVWLVWRACVGRMKTDAVKLTRALMFFTSTTLRCAFRAWRLTTGQATVRRGFLLQVAGRILHRTMSRVRALSLL